jgi:hypothetical protein
LDSKIIVLLALSSGKIPLVEVVMITYNPFNKPPMVGIFWAGILNQVFQAIKQKQARFRLYRLLGSKTIGYRHY